MATTSDFMPHELVQLWWAGQVDDAAFYRAMKKSLLPVYQVIDPDHDGAWRCVAQPEYDNAADRDRRIIYVPSLQK